MSLHKDSNQLVIRATEQAQGRQHVSGCEANKHLRISEGVQVSHERQREALKPAHVHPGTSELPGFDKQGAAGLALYHAGRRT